MERRSSGDRGDRGGGASRSARDRGEGAACSSEAQKASSTMKSRSVTASIELGTGRANPASGKRSILNFGAAGGGLLRPRTASKLFRPRSGVRRRAPSLLTVHGGRWGAVLRQGRRHIFRQLPMPSESERLSRSTPKGLPASAPLPSGHSFIRSAACSSRAASRFQLHAWHSSQWPHRTGCADCRCV